jgi:hypothetical protein
MSATETLDERSKKSFVFIASELNRIFPDLDLRFNLKAGSKQIRFLVADIAEDTFELNLDEQEPQELIYEATLAIKEIARLFDA